LKSSIMIVEIISLDELLAGAKLACNHWLI
jgi:hypothetical protein